MGLQFFIEGKTTAKQEILLEQIKHSLSNIELTSASEISGKIKQYFPHNIDLKENRLLCSIDSIGIAICSGHIDGLFSRLFNSYSLYQKNEIESLILISKTAKEAWWNHQEAQLRKGKPIVANNGNRQNWGLVKKALNSSSHWLDIPVVGIVLEREISSNKFNHFEW